MVNRYRDLLSVLPESKELYGGNVTDGTVILPFLDAPHQLDVNAVPNTRYQVFLNDVFSGEVTTDDLGFAQFRTIRRLPAGDYEFKLIGPNADTSRTAGFFSVRAYATLMAAYAENFEALDARIDSIARARSLRTVDSEYMEASYGRSVHQTAPSDFLLNDYRVALQQLRPAYRHFGGIRYGVTQAVSALTSVNPVVRPRAWRQSWVPGYDILHNGNLQTRTRLIPATADGLSNLNRQSRLYIHTGVSGPSAITTGFRQPPTPQRLLATTTSAGQALITGTNAVGEDVAELVPPTADTGTFRSETVFTSIDSLQAYGVDPIAIGLADSHFVSLLDAGDYLEPGATIDLTWTGSGSEFELGAGDAAEPTSEGDLFDVSRRALIVGNTTGGGSFASLTKGAALHNRLYIDSGSGPVTFSINSPYTVANIVSQLGGIAFEVSNGVQAAVGLSASGRLRVLPGPADASPIIFGPVSSTFLSSTASSTTISVEDADRLPTEPFQARIRGLRAASQFGSIAALADPYTATLTRTTGSYNFTSDDIGQHVHIVSGHADNQGVHRIIAVNSTTQVVLQHEPTTVDFTNASGQGYNVYGQGELVNVIANNRGGIDQLTLETATEFVWPVGATFEVVTEVPLADDFYPGLGRVRVALDETYRPYHDHGDSLSFASGIVTLASTRLDSTGLSGASVTISDAVNAGNNGTFTVSGVGANLVTFTNASGVSETNDDFEWSIDDPPAVTDTLDIVGADMPDDWMIDGPGIADPGNSSSVTTLQQRGALNPSNILLTTDDDDNGITWQIEEPHALDFRGLELRVSLWVQELSAASSVYSLTVSFDGTTFSAVPIALPAATTLVNTVYDATDEVASQLVHQYTGTFFVPYHATRCILRFHRTSAASGEVFAFERASLTLESFGGADTQQIVRSAKREKFGEFLYVWSPEELEAEHITYLGLPPTADMASPADPSTSLPATLSDDETTITPRSYKAGHIDYVTPAHGYWDRRDVTEYSGTQAVNLAGFYTSEDWVPVNIGEGLIGLDIVVGVPARVSYLAPSNAPSYIEGEILNVTDGGSGTGIADLGALTAHEGPTSEPIAAHLYELRSVDTIIPNPSTGRSTIIPAGHPIPVPEDQADGEVDLPWYFTGTNSIKISAAYFNPSSEYVIDYESLTRVTTTGFQLPSNRAEFVWMIDAPIYTRSAPRQVPTDVTVPLNFSLTTFSASIGGVVDLTTGATLTRDDGETKTTLDSQSWFFLDARNVKIDATQLDIDSVYTLTYRQLALLVDSPVGVELEWRSADFHVDLATADWLPVHEADIASPYIAPAGNPTGNTPRPWHQLRATFTGIQDVHDLRVLGLGLKGVRLDPA